MERGKNLIDARPSKVKKYFSFWHDSITIVQGSAPYQHREKYIFASVCNNTARDLEKIQSTLDFHRKKDIYIRFMVLVKFSWVTDFFFGYSTTMVTA